MVLVNLSPVQNYLARQAAKALAEQLDTKVAVRNVRIDFLNHVLLEGLYVGDHAGDTLAYIGEARVRISDWFLFNQDVPVLKYAGLKNAYIHLYRLASGPDWNYKFIEDAFSGKPDTTRPKKSGQQFKLDLKQIVLEQVRFHMDDAWGGYDYDIDIGSFHTSVDRLDFDKRIASADHIKVGNASIRLRDFKGGKPPGPKRIPVIDTTAFNPDRWQLDIRSLVLDGCHFLFRAKDTPPYPAEFDPEYIEVSQLDLTARDLQIQGDTLKGNIDHFGARERCGLIVRELKSRVSVSPKASICENLYLETNNSKIYDYYAMHYERFPDFEDYIRKVSMTARLKDAVVDTRDIAFFAPALHDLPMMIRISGNGKGTVDYLEVSKLIISDGFSTAKGDMLFTGLPDLDRTYMAFHHAEIFTTGSSVLKYAPALKNNPNVNMNTLDYAYFNGDFNGYLRDFKAKGTVHTNLGTLTSDIQMKLPQRGQPTYSGHLSSLQFEAGRLFNQPVLGAVSMDAELQGASFDEAGIHLNASSRISGIRINDYVYRDIDAEGTFDNKQFEGKLTVNDSNLALNFDGKIDFSGQNLQINATANVLNCDLQALQLAATPVRLAADFDLDCSGKTIDDFTGSVKLYNINLLKKEKRLDLDSVNIQTYLTEGIKHIDIESNLLKARVSGRFLLTEIPNSAMYYLSKYLPNYIKGSGKIAADQDITFNIQTREISDMLVAFTQSASGFDSASIDGTLNTSTQSLTLNASVPYGKLGSISLREAGIRSTGDWNKLRLSGTAASFRIGKDLLNTTMSLEASVGRDSLNYTIATQSTDQFGTATVSGQAYARGDSLFMTFQPSELYLNDVKWEIPSGSRIVYTKDYLSINDLFLNSGLQQIAVKMEHAGRNAPLLIRSSNLDLALLASFSPLAAYQPDGRINGDIRLENLFSATVIDANIKATGVKLGSDTIGTIVLNGAYEPEKELVTLRSESGVFHERFALTANGKISMDTRSGESLDGMVRIDNFPVKLLAPFLQGYAGRLSGSADGEIAMKGTVRKPVMAGNLELNNIGARIDYTGTYYTIPKGNIILKDQRAILDDITILDVYKNTATASGSVSMSDLDNIQLSLQLKTPQFEIINLKDYENDLFYGHAIANTDFSISGSVNNMRMSIRATPTQTSHLYIPYNASGDVSTSTYISFKSYGTTQQQPLVSKNKSKLSVTITALLNPLMDVTFVIDPATGDQINGTGNGSLSINVPANDDYSMFGNYIIDKGSYTFTFRQVLTKTFNINSGSSINFNGDLANTRLDIKATYPARARLFDLLNANEQLQLRDNKEIEDAKAQQAVNVQLSMKGTLSSTDLSYQIELPERRAMVSAAYSKLARINQSDQSELTNQVGALLLLGSFVPPEGISSNLAVNSAKNTLGETIANSASPLLTSALNKIIGDKTISVLVQYKSYSSTDIGGGAATDAVSRNELKLGLKKNYFNDRLSVQVGSAYDWGRPTTANTSAGNFNLAGDFRAQYLLTPDGGISLTGFRTSNYDVIVNDNIARTGVGVTFRKSFDNLFEFFHSRKRVLEEQQKKKNRLLGNTK